MCLPDCAPARADAAPVECHTAIVIAHRFASSRNADRILVLNAGRIVARRTHDELMRARSLYSRLCRMYYASFNDMAAEGDGETDVRAS